MRTVQNLQDRVSAELSGIDLTEVNDLFGCFEQAAATLIQQADVPEASGRLALFLYDGVTDYSPGTTIFGSAVVDLRPQGVARLPWDTAEKTYVQRFDRVKCQVPFGYLLTFEYRQGTPIMRVAQAKAQQRIVLDWMNSTTGWVAAGGASNLLLDSTVYYQQPAALRFNLAASTPGTLTKTLTRAIDLTAYQGVGVGFLPLMIPAQNLTSLKLRIGSDAANYYEVDVTTGFLAAFYANDYQLVSFNLSTATTTGTPVITAMDYVQIIATGNGTAMNNVRFGGLWISLPSPHELLFYSPAIFKAGTSDPSATISSINDLIILGDPAYNIYVRECARAVAQQQGGTMGGIVAALDLELYGAPNKTGLYQKFRGSNPSEELRSVDNWYY